MVSNNACSASRPQGPRQERERPLRRSQEAPCGGLDLPGLLETNRTQFGNLRYLYEQLIDDGNTNEVVEEITSTWPEGIWELRDYLLAKSPYLSVTVLMELVNKQGVPDAIKAQICIANPDATKKEGFLKWAEFDAIYPLPGYILDNIVASWNTKTYRTELEMSMADRHTDMVQAANHWINWLYRDTLPPPPDTVQHVWRRVRTNAARYAEAAFLMGHGDLAQAERVMLDMPLEKELNPVEYAERGRMLGYIAVVQDALDDGRTAYQLTGTEVATLKTLIGDHYDRPSVWVRNLLCVVYNDCMAPYTGGEAEPKSAHRPAQDRTATSATTKFSLQPNPASTWAACNYDMGLLPKNAYVVLRDLSGRSLQTVPATNAMGQVLLDTRGLATGTYVVELVEAGAVLATEKLIVQH